ncbi:MAG TPA: GtrA family protein [Alphaproteobacteria bacterium]|jgi:putative flippase GtrA|nr:GtrA family protein [Alphaproteobacteria bacterium]
MRWIFKMPMVGQSARYSAVGAVCAVASNIVIIGSNLAGINDQVAIILAVATVTPLAYVLQSWFTFHSPLSMQRFLRFVAGVGVGTLWFVLLMTLFQHVLGMTVWVASPLTTLLIFIWNFAAARWAILWRMHNALPGADG